MIIISITSLIGILHGPVHVTCQIFPPPRIGPTNSVPSGNGLNSFPGLGPVPALVRRSGERLTVILVQDNGLQNDDEFGLILALLYISFLFMVFDLSMTTTSQSTTGTTAVNTAATTSSAVDSTTVEGVTTTVPVLNTSTAPAPVTTSTAIPSTVDLGPSK